MEVGCPSSPHRAARLHRRAIADMAPPVRSHGSDEDQPPDQPITRLLASTLLRNGHGTAITRTGLTCFSGQTMSV